MSDGLLIVVVACCLALGALILLVFAILGDPEPQQFDKDGEQGSE